MNSAQDAQAAAKTESGTETGPPRVSVAARVASGFAVAAFCALLWFVIETRSAPPKPAARCLSAQK